MAFIENDTAVQERFNLLLLEPGEIYFEDYSVYFYPSCETEEESIRRKQRGHLKICSKSVVFVPKESQFPILKFPMKDVSNIDEYSGSLFSKLPIRDKTLKLSCTVCVEMKQGNIISPYIFRKGQSDHIFSLNYASVDDCLPQMCQLHRASTLPPADKSAMINAIVLSRQSRVTFNTSWIVADTLIYGTPLANRVDPDETAPTGAVSSGSTLFANTSNHVTMRLEDLYETIELECQGDKITPLVTNPGRIMLTSRRLYFQPFNNVDRVPVIKIKLKEIKQIIKRRFLLKQIGLEIFCDSRSAHPHLYLSLQSPANRDSLYQKLMAQSDVQIEMSDQHDMTLRWQNGQISNYEYLMFLNSSADRSFFDLTQYPVMPWVIQDMESKILDLEKPETFRDLSKPIGALNEERLARMKERYQDMPEPKFLYGAHYSTPGYVLFYLARMAPEYVLCLQNGKFDQPDRMFNSLYELWQNCLQGAADFKELIPEFYESDGEYLINSGISNFGIRQDGRPVGDVELPPWALDARDFISKMRAALECDYVSKHIHEWIDLIFGYKQRGIEAEKADNVFYYMTYEGAIDLDSIEDPNERACMEIQIMEFGQIPRQLFTTPHPMRYGPREVPRSLSTLSQSEGSEEMDRSERGSIGNDEPEGEGNGLAAKTADFTTMQRKNKYCLHKDAVTDVKLSVDKRCVFSVSQDSLLKMYSLEDQRQLRSVTMTTMALSSCLVMPDNKTIVCGSWDNNVYFYSVEFGRVLDCLQAHEDAVSCICWKRDILVTSSWDSTVKVWQLMAPTAQQGFQSAEYVNQLDHDSGVCHMAVDAEAEILVTGTMDGQICVWNLIHYYMTSQHQVHSGQVNSLLLSQDKHQIISCGDDKYLRITDLDSGTELFVKDVKSTILCLALAGSTLLCGTESGKIQIWDIDKAVLLQEEEAHEGAVTCLELTEENTLLSGGVDKTISIWRPAIR